MMVEERIRVVVADDHPIVLEGVRRFLESEPCLEVVGCVDSVRELDGLLEREAPIHVVVLDVCMPGMQGAPTIASLVSKGVRVLLFSHQEVDDYVAHLVRAGVAGFVSKGDPVDELLAAVSAVHEGGRWVSPELAVLLSELPDRPPALATLTEREREVFDLLASGKTPKEISIDLELAPSTAYARIERVRVKLGVSSLLDVVRYAERWRER